jgi:hypothetical protein
MEKDEIFRRAMAAALAVTGRAGRRAAQFSVGICIASATTGCLQDAANDDRSMMSFADMGRFMGDVVVEGPNMRPDGGLIDEFDAQTADFSVGVDVDSAHTDLSDLGFEPEDDASVTSADAETSVDGSGAEHCLPVEGNIADWRCCEGHNWDRSVEGCEPCDVGTERDTWAHCVSCEAQDESPEAFEDYMACCGAVQFDFDMGCMAWGPPAPPKWDGRTLDELLQDIDRTA